MFNLRRDIEKGIKKYPTLLIDESVDFPLIKGSFAAHDKTGKIKIETYDLLIAFRQDYPFSFPYVLETSKKIPRELSRHIRSDNTICFANPQDELLACKNGITFLWFLEEILNPHLCREFVREKTDKYPTGERSHGYEGVWEGYYEIFNTKDKKIILSQLEEILKPRKIGRNTACYCNSGKKYKGCHEKVDSYVLQIGTNAVLKIYKELETDYLKQNERFK